MGFKLNDLKGDATQRRVVTPLVGPNRPERGGFTMGFELNDLKDDATQRRVVTPQVGPNRPERGATQSIHQWSRFFFQVKVHFHPGVLVTSPSHKTDGNPLTASIWPSPVVCTSCGTHGQGAIAKSRIVSPYTAANHEARKFFMAHDFCFVQLWAHGGTKVHLCLVCSTKCCTAASLQRA